MKTKITFLTLFAAVGALFVGAGCSTVSTTSSRYPGSPTFPPSDPAKVEVVRAEPVRPHVRLGEIKPAPFSPSVDAKTIETALRKQAAKLGADAVVVVSDRVQGPEAPFVGGWRTRSAEAVPLREIVAVAIKYQ
jgi:hypothetical protein